MRVLGVDPGTAITGYGIVEGTGRGPTRLIECGVVRTRPRDPLPDRLQQIYQGLSEVITRHVPDLMSVEGVFYGSNVRTTVVLGHARGVILLAAADGGLPVVEYSPAQIKKAVVGRGAAVKPQVGFMVQRILRLKEAPAPADAADGVAVALTHFLVGAKPSRALERRA